MSDSFDVKKRVKTKGETNLKTFKDISKSDSDAEKGKSNKIPLRVFSRLLVIFSLLLIVYFSTNVNVHIIAKQSEILEGKGQIVQCSKQYLDELGKYKDCFPKECKRFVTDKVVTSKEVEELLNVAKKGFALGGSSGGASILDLHSGALSKGEHFINIYKIDLPQPLFSPSDFNIYKIVKQKIKYSICHHFGVHPDKIYLTHPTFFSKITDKKAVTLHDQYWHPHVDKETYKSFHYTTLLYLGDYNIDFKGGRFVFVDDKFNSTIEPRKARVNMFTSGSENLHYVEKVSAGIRYAMTISFTCDEKFAIDDPSMVKYANNN